MSTSGAHEGWDPAAYIEEQSAADPVFAAAVERERALLDGWEEQAGRILSLRDSGDGPGRSRTAVDEDGNPLWQASSEGDGMCPVCGHAPDLHGSTEGCQWHYADGTHLTEPTACGCPLVVVTTDARSQT